mgnify:CR=1 FL=1
MNARFLGSLSQPMHSNMYDPKPEAAGHKSATLSKFSLKGQRTQWACGLESHQAVVRISNVNLFSASLEPLGDKVKGLNSFVLEAIQNPKQKCWKSSQQFFLEMKWGCHLDTHSVWGVLPPTWH